MFHYHGVLNNLEQMTQWLLSFSPCYKKRNNQIVSLKLNKIAQPKEYTLPSIMFMAILSLILFLKQAFHFGTLNPQCS